MMFVAPGHVNIPVPPRYRNFPEVLARLREHHDTPAPTQCHLCRLCRWHGKRVLCAAVPSHDSAAQRRAQHPQKQGYMLVCASSEPDPYAGEAPTLPMLHQPSATTPVSLEGFTKRTRILRLYVHFNRSADFGHATW